MRVVVNDHSGHAFPIQLSRQLAAEGHEVLHAYSTTFQSPKGDLDRLASDPPGLAIFPITTREPFAKYSLIKRRRQEIEYARCLVDRMKSFQPDVILSGTTPLFVQQHVQAYTRKSDIKFVYWCQDIYTIAIADIIRKRIGWPGMPLGHYFRRLESDLLRKSTHVISITEDFSSILKEWRVDPARVTCIPNWAPMERLRPVEKRNPWSLRHGLADKICVTYSGTLGLKHNPDMLLAAAKYFQPRPDVVLLVISEGLGADFLQREKEHQGLDNLLLLPFQDFEVMDQVLGASDVLLGILEKQAGLFSVPSKVLTYLCAGKPIVLAVPPDNLSARIIRENEAGFCVDPGDSPAFCNCIRELIEQPSLRGKVSRNARAYAEKHFRIQDISRRFMHVFINS